MFAYEYIESFTQRSGDDNQYHMSTTFAAWISQEMEKRRETLQPHYPEAELQIFLTTAQYRRQAVFLLGWREENQSRVVEGWYFRILGAPDNPQAIQLTLDRVNIQQLFSESKT